MGSAADTVQPKFLKFRNCQWGAMLPVGSHAKSLGLGSPAWAMPRLGKDDILRLEAPGGDLHC